MEAPIPRRRFRSLVRFSRPVAALLLRSIPAHRRALNHRSTAALTRGERTVVGNAHSQPRTVAERGSGALRSSGSELRALALAAVVHVRSAGTEDAHGHRHWLVKAGIPTPRFRGGSENRRVRKSTVGCG
eukprot:1145653-Pyramimonas_sp.AAC.1